MLGELTVKMEDKLELELKKFLAKVFDKTERVPTDKISFNTGVYYAFGNTAECFIEDINHVEHNGKSLKYQIKIFYPKKMDTDEWSEQDRKELFFTITFTGKDSEHYFIVVNSADTKNFANYEVMVYFLPDRNEYRLYKRIAAYTLSALTELEEYKFVDRLMEEAKKLVRYHTRTKDNVSKNKKEFLSIISDAINTGN